jgi:hypothetical protein
MLALAGCAGIPDSGSVHVGREIPVARGLGDDINVRVLPQPPRPGMTPTDVVHGFLRAMANRDGSPSYEIARKYLTSRAAAAWKSDVRVTTYDDGGVRLVRKQDSDGTSIRFRAPRVGVIDTRGDFSPRGGPVRATFGLSKAGGQWRIESLPDGALLSSSDVTRSYRFADVYYANRSGGALVPEQVLLAPDPGAISTALMRALVSGPGTWLAPAVRTAFPSGTELLGSVPVDRTGAAEVNLSAAARRASEADLQTMSAQIAWTLRQVQEVHSVRLLADGSQLAGFDTDASPDEFVSFDPAPRSPIAQAFFRTGESWAFVEADTAPALAPAQGLVALAMSRSGDRLAALRPTRFSTALAVGPAGTEPTIRIRARRLTPPTFGAEGDVYTVVTDRTGQWVARVTSDGDVQRVAATSAVTRRPVQELRISPDGARVAAVVGRPGRGRLLVGRVAVRDGDQSFDGFRAVLPGVRDIRGLSWGWTAPGQVVVSAAVTRGQRELLAVDANGYSSVTISTAGLAAQPTSVATAPGRALVVAAGGDIWVDQTTGWRREGPGAEPRYAG